MDTVYQYLPFIIFINAMALAFSISRTMALRKERVEK